MAKVFLHPQVIRSVSEQPKVFGGGHKSAATFMMQNFTNKDLEYIINKLSEQINILPQENDNLF